MAATSDIAVGTAICGSSVFVVVILYQRRSLLSQNFESQVAIKIDLLVRYPLLTQPHKTP